MRGSKGFTLIELLVSMTLLALLFVLLLGGLRFGARAWERGTTDSNASQDMRAAQDLIRRQIEHACPRLAPASPSQASSVEFSGNSSQMQFFGPAPSAAGGAACLSMTLRVDRGRLTLRLGNGINAATTEILGGIRAASFAYLPAKGGWQSDWHGQPTLPALVRVQVTFPPGDTRVWPELFAAPRISAEADCTYDATTKSCRGS